MGSEATQGLSLSPEQQCASALRYDYDDYDLDRYIYLWIAVETVTHLFCNIVFVGIKSS